jgi:hypothetical protein
MIRRQAAFSVSRHGGFDTEGDANPLETVANLSDVMLVLAVALMLALIVHWRVDVSAGSDLSDQTLEPIETEMTEGRSQDTLSGDGYEEVGTVYRDSATGEMYLLTE